MLRKIFWYSLSFTVLFTALTFYLRFYDGYSWADALKMIGLIYAMVALIVAFFVAFCLLMTKKRERKNESK